ncbi:hypothetical protein HDF24_26000 [Mucilaginibacter sp. X4EP1]|uniref:hypothetical protein n=1 Tax=Mucilaginibacter sp. X4EP1 TaxID=2723092 RepID=UPI002167BA83|nr:hypothetical protein [Mucilaginibacter sp. X4EP1]MCS3816410.1 hypothetical protein [Mucilaginibacter sp. X4EP1]
MKNSLYGLITLLMVIFIISACNKFADPLVSTSTQSAVAKSTALASGNGLQLLASKYKVKINEPDTLLLSGAKSTDSIRWSVSPAGFDSLITQKNKALVFFKKAGTYQVKAADNGGTPLVVSITVIDSVYHPQPQYTTTPLTGDQITLVPHFYSNPAVDSSYLTFVAQTHNVYCGTSKLNLTDSLVNNTYAIDFLNVIQPTPCVIGSSPIGTVINFTQKIPGNLPNGTYPLSVTLNGTTYTGSIVATSTIITFKWNYNSGVLISPKQINR